MTVAELKKVLADLPDDATVVIWDDHWSITDWVPLIKVELEKNVAGAVIRVKIG